MSASSLCPIADVSAEGAYAGSRSTVALIFEEGFQMFEALSQILEDLEIGVAATRMGTLLPGSPELEAVDLIFADADQLLGWLDADRTPMVWRGTPGTIIIACGQRDNYNSIIQALRCGADDYLVMPFDRSVLAAKLRCFGHCSRQN